MMEEKLHEVAAILREHTPLSKLPEQDGYERTLGESRARRLGHLRRVIDLIQANVKGAKLGPVLEKIENALRADQVKLIEAECG
jgi:hypothetical protein